jgi:ABC-type polysaccharide/polyol phosphate transport system ATPase subunit
MNDIVIDVRAVEKHFYRFRNPMMGAIRRLTGITLRSGTYDIFRAIDGVSLSIKRGEVVGIVGANGSGKTTLLKMIAGLLPVDAGSISVRGSVHALLALGVGVNPEFTGRENIFYGGLLLGMSRLEISQKLPSIVEFSELGDFIDQPFRTYSSGMRARLLFSISMSITPEILIVDEALATGDAAFVQKCFYRVKQLLSAGVTMLFVSHNISQVMQFCSRCLVLEKGRLVFDGETEEAVDSYIESQHRRAREQVVAPTSASKSLRGTGEVTIEEVFMESDGARTHQIAVGEPCVLVLGGIARKDLDCVRLCVELRSEKSAVTFSYLPSSPGALGDKSMLAPFALKEGKWRIRIEIAAFTGGDGRYRIDAELFSGAPEYQFSYDTCYCHHPRALEINAIYRDSNLFGRGVLAELPIKALRVESWL